MCNGRTNSLRISMSGTTVAQVNALIKQYTEMRRMMQGMFSGGGLGNRMMRRMAGIPGMDGGDIDPRNSPPRFPKFAS